MTRGWTLDGGPDGRGGRRSIAALALALAIPAAAQAQTPNWIWHSATSAPSVYLRKTFRAPPLTWNARLTVSADDRAEVFLNGVPVAECRDWQQPLRAEVSVRLNQGENVIAVQARNGGGPAGVLVHLNVGGATNFVSDASWLAAVNGEPDWSSLAFNAAHWTPARTLGPHGAAPWGEVLFQPSATPAASLKAPPGFQVELLRSAGPDEGSWICLAFDRRGRLIVSPEGDARPLLRLTLAEGRVAKAEPVPAPVRYAMGLLDVEGILYANARGPSGAGLYRLEDKNGNDRFDAEETALLKKFEGGSEHGYHALALGPDRRIYILNGNGTKVPDGLAPESPLRNYAEDALTGARGESESRDGAPAPGCHVLRYDPRTGAFELFAGGMRNAYDFDFNGEGELFAFDSDMEWDWGTPWYKATRILHLVSGGEYGWRDGTRMWSDDYEDGLPPVAYLGIGSPTGVKFATRSHFPGKYRTALYALDWSYGRIFAVHLEPDGAGYRGHAETFLEGRPLNLTSLAFGPDGAMYFITGGRGTQSGLYRVSGSGDAPSEKLPDEAVARGNRGRELRRRLEALHGRNLPENVQFIWPQFEMKDRFVRFAAGVALEAQDPAYWRKAALGERSPNSALAALRALVRVSDSSAQPEILAALGRFPLSSLNETQQIQKLRAIELTMARHGRPNVELTRVVTAELSAAYPAASWKLNRELSRILLALEAPGAVEKTVDLLAAAGTQEEQLHYVELLRNVRSGWRIEDRKTFFAWFSRPRDPKAHTPELRGWFEDAGRAYADGAYFDKYLRDFRREAMATLTAGERAALAPWLAAPIAPAGNAAAGARAFVKDWQMADLLPALERGGPANLARGRQAFAEAQCLSCHRFGNDGGMAGPDLTAAGSRYSARDLLESILEPSKVLSDQYRDHTVVLRDGDSYSGRLIAESASGVVLETDRVAGTREEFAREKIESLRPSAVSPMPEGLASVLSREELLDLLAYLRSGSGR